MEKYERIAQGDQVHVRTLAMYIDDHITQDIDLVAVQSGHTSL